MNCPIPTAAPLIPLANPEAAIPAEWGFTMETAIRATMTADSNAASLAAGLPLPLMAYRQMTMTPSTARTGTGLSSPLAAAVAIGGTIAHLTNDTRSPTLRVTAD